MDVSWLQAAEAWYSPDLSTGRTAVPFFRPTFEVRCSAFLMVLISPGRISAIVNHGTTPSQFA